MGKKKEKHRMTADISRLIYLFLVLEATHGFSF